MIPNIKISIELVQMFLKLSNFKKMIIGRLIEELQISIEPSATLPWVCWDTCPSIMYRTLKCFTTNRNHVLNKVSMKPHTFCHVTEDTSRP